GLLHVAVDLFVGLAGVADQFQHGLGIAGDLYRSLVDAFGQGADFIGDHGEATAGFSGTRSFDGGVERQQVGLIGDAANQLGGLADAGRALREVFDGLVEGFDLVADLVDLARDVLHFAQGNSCAFKVDAGRIGNDLGAARNFADGAG